MKTLKKKTMIEKEERTWRTIPGHDRYQINISTKTGRCRNANYRGTGRIKEISTNPNNKGRLYWNIDGICYQAGRWIAITYPELIQNEYFEGAEIDHINTDPLDNRPENLRWVTRKENINNPLTAQHNSAVRKGRTQKPEVVAKRADSLKGKLVNRTDQSKPILQYTKDMTLVKEYPSAEEAARQTGINRANIGHAVINYRNHKTAGGYVWLYKDKNS